MYMLEQLIYQLGDDEMTELRNDDPEIYKRRLQEFNDLLRRHNGMHQGGGYFLKVEFTDFWLERKFSSLKSGRRGLTQIEKEIENLENSRLAIVEARAVVDKVCSSPEDYFENAFEHLPDVLIQLEDVRHPRNLQIAGSPVFSFTLKAKEADPQEWDKKVRLALAEINSSSHYPFMNDQDVDEEGKLTFAREDFVVWWSDRQQVRFLYALSYVCLQGL